MVQQDFFDSIEFPLPEVHRSKKVFYFVDFSQLKWVEGHLIKECIYGQYLEQSQLDIIESIVESLYLQFRTFINIQITEKRGP